MKICENCRHCFEDYWGTKCRHPDVEPMDLATGERQYADWARKFGECGREGKLFEPRPPRIPWHVRKLWQISKWLESRQ